MGRKVRALLGAGGELKQEEEAELEGEQGCE